MPVHFNDKIDIHTMRVWAYASHQARISSWQQEALDRERFQRRIIATAPILNIFITNHLKKIDKLRKYTNLFKILKVINNISFLNLASFSCWYRFLVLSISHSFIYTATSKVFKHVTGETCSKYQS